MPKQRPELMSQKEFDELQKKGFTNLGPRNNSDASEQQASFGNVESGSDFAQQQRRAMLAKVVNSADDDDKSSGDDDDNSSGGGAAAIAGIAIGIGALLFGGYKAYQHFTSPKENASSHTSTSNNHATRNVEKPKWRPKPFETRDIDYETDDDNEHQENVVKNDTKDLCNSVRKNIGEQEIPNLNHYQDGVNSKGMEIPILKLRQEDINFTGTKIPTLNLQQAGEAVKDANFINQTDENCKEDSEKSQQLGEPSSDPSSENAQAVKDNNTVEDIKEDSEDANKNSKEGSDESQLVDQPPYGPSPENAQVNMNDCDEEVDNINREFAGSCIKGMGTDMLKRG